MLLVAVGVQGLQPVWAEVVLVVMATRHRPAPELPEQSTREAAEEVVVQLTAMVVLAARVLSLCATLGRRRQPAAR